MWWFILTFFVGMAVGKGHLLPAALLRQTQKIVLPCLVLLVLLLGYQLGSQRNLVAQLPQIGWQAALIAILSTIGSALCAWLTQPFFFPTQPKAKQAGIKAKGTTMNHPRSLTKENDP